jgi:FkbM family methyltransferase
MFWDKLKYTAAEVVKKHPYTLSVVWNVLPHIGFLLPHEKSYLGFRHIATDPDGLFLDVGANNGMSAAGFRHLNKTYEIFSIEANRFHEKSLERLKKSLRGFDYRIVAAGSSKSYVKLFTPIYKGVPVHTHTSTSLDYLQVSLRRDFPSRVVRRFTYDEQKVEVIPLDDLDLSPSIVKIDVEGFDYQVLLGLRATVEKHRPYLHIEYTPNEMGDFERFFREHSYFLFVFDRRRDVFLPFRKAREDETHRTSGLQVNLFCVPSERVAGLPVSKA